MPYRIIEYRADGVTPKMTKSFVGGEKAEAYFDSLTDDLSMICTAPTGESPYWYEAYERGGSLICRAEEV